MVLLIKISLIDFDTLKLKICGIRDLAKFQLLSVSLLLAYECKILVINFIFCLYLYTFFLLLFSINYFSFIVLFPSF